MCCKVYYNSAMKTWIIIIAVVCGFSVLQAFSVPEMQDFSRYEVILQRRPFGAPPAREIAPPPPVAPVDDPFKSLRLVGITRGDEGDLSVGIADIAANPPRSIFLTMGESYDGLTLLDADYDLEGALIRKDMNDKWLYLGGIQPGGGPVEQYQAAAPGQSGRSEASKGVQSYIERMRARRAAVRTTVIEPPKLQGEALQKHLQEYNMELIRQAAKGDGGAPPLPIPLTPEQDKQLVEEGVLPPQ